MRSPKKKVAPSNVLTNRSGNSTLTAPLNDPTGPAISSNDLAGKLLLEEFKQLHEHIRQRATAMNQILSLAVVGNTALLSATTAYALNHLSSISIPVAYLFLAPLPLLIFGLAMLATFRDDQYRMGFYLQVFFEERIGGAQFHVNLKEFRKVVRGEAQSPAAYVLWALFSLATIEFVFALHLAAPGRSLVPSTAFVPFAGLMLYQQYRFSRSKSRFEALWRSIMTCSLKTSAENR